MRTCRSCGEENADKAKFCAECGTPLGAQGDREERKIVTALFCDVVGSTSLGETYEPEILKPALRAYFEEARRAVEHHGGQVEKYIGDAVAAVFGMPSAHEDDALRAVRAAHDIRERIQDHTDDGSIRIECRIGVNTGEVLSSGDDTPLLGDTMNTAARLQGAAPPGGIVIGEPTYHLVRDAVVADPIEPIVAKGKTEPVPAYLVREVIEGAVGVTRHLESPLVGRLREQRLLSDALEQAVAERSVHLFTLVGAPGIGKTRLVEEFMRTAGSQAAVVHGRCLAYGEGITFWPIAEIVRGAAGVLETDDLDVAREKVAGLLPDPRDRPTIAERVTELLGMRATPNAEETFWAVRKVLEAMAADRPLLCVIEDLHWAEPGLLDLIDHVTDWSREVPIVLLCNARPEFLEHRPNWAGGKLNATTLALQPLAQAEVDELIGNLLGGAGLHPDVVTRISQAAEGNPLFVEQLLAMLADEGTLRLVDGRWSADEEHLVVPPSIRALLGARLDALAVTERRLLEAAAVEGRSFHVGTVAALSGLPRAEAAATLTDLARKDLLRPGDARLEGEDAFRFRHILIADVAYETIPKTTRADLHERFAEELEARIADRVTEFEEILGHHLERAHRLRTELGLPDERELAERASTFLAGAGSRAVARGDATAGASLLLRAMELRPIGVDRFALLPDLVYALTATARGRDALQLLDQAIDATSETSAGLLWHRLRVERIGVRADLGRLTDGRSALEEAEVARRAAEEAGDDLLLSRALAAGSVVLEEPGEFFDLSGAKELLEGAVDAARRAGNVMARDDAENFLGGVYCLGPYAIDEGVAFCDRCFADGTSSRLQLWGYALANGYARAAAFRGEFDEARALLREAAEHFADLGAMRGWLQTFGVGASVERLAGDERAAGQLLSDAIEAVTDLDPGAVNTIAPDIALHHAIIGDADEAERWMARIEALRGGPWVAAIQVRIHLARGQVDRAVDLARERIADDREAGWLDDWALLLESAADAFEASGAAAEVRPTLDRLVDAYRRKGNLVALRRAEERIATL